MKKILLILLGALALALPAKAEDIWMMAAENGFPESNSNAYSLIHLDGNNFITLPYSHSNWYDASTITPTYKTKGVYQLNNSTIETVKFEKGSSEGSFKMKFYNRNSSSTSYYFTGITSEGYIKASYISSAVEVQVKFKYGAYGTIHYNGKELQLIDNKFVFADPTSDEAGKIYLYMKRGSHPSNGVKNVTIRMYASTSNSFNDAYPNPLSISNKEAATFYIRDRVWSDDSSIRIVPTDDEPSNDFSIVNSTANGSPTTLTFNKDATPGTYHFTGYFQYNYNTASSPVDFTITVKGDMQLVWMYGPRYGQQTELPSDEFFDVEWTPEEYFFNVAEKDPTTGRLTKIDPRFITLKTSQSSILSTLNSTSSNVGRGYGFAFIANSNVNYPYEVTYTATSTVGAAVPDLKLRVSAMKPEFKLTGSSDFKWSEDGIVKISFSSPRLQTWAGSVVYITGTLVPAGDFSEITDTNLPDGNYVAGQAKVTLDKTITSTTAGTMEITNIPCSGLYNLILKYNGYRSGTKYVDPDYESVIPLNIYPSSEGLEMGIVTHKNGVVNPDNIVRTAPIVGNSWTGPKEYDDATAETSIYRDVVLSSTTTAGIGGYYKTIAATEETEASSARVSAPADYDFTSAVEQKYMNLFDVNQFSLYVAKNGAIAPTPITITLKKTDSVVSGIDAVEVNEADAPAEYFNLQGVRVANPIPGNVYIVRRGAAVSKTIYSQSK